MKSKLTLTVLILALIACDKNETGEQKVISSINFTEVNNEVVDELNDNIKENEETFEDDMSNDLAAFDGAGKAKKDGDRAYDSLTGYWSRSFDWNRSGMDSTVFENVTRVRSFEDIGHVNTDVRFSDDVDNSIQFPHQDPPSVTSIHILRDVSREIAASVIFYIGDTEVERHGSRQRDAETNSDATLSRLDSISWSVNATADRSVYFSITKNDSIFEFDKTMSLVFEDVIVKKVNRRHGDESRRGIRRAIVSGKITHTVNFPNSNVLKIVTEFFNCFDGQETKRLVRTIYKNDVFFREITINCN